MRRVTLFDMRIDAGGREELLLAARALRGRGGQILTVNPQMLMRAREDEALRGAMARATLAIPDGNGVKIALGMCGVKSDVLAGVDLGELLPEAGDSIGIVGGRAGVAARAFSHLAARCRGLRAAFLLDGYTFDEASLCALLREHRPTFLYVALGVPRQELLIDRVRACSPSTVCIGLGGSLDVYAADVRRAPVWLRRLRLEWLYRMLREPHRMRLLPVLFRFIYLSMKESVRIKCTKKRKSAPEN